MPNRPDEDRANPSRDEPEDDSLDPLLVAAAQALEPTERAGAVAAASGGPRGSQPPRDPLLSTGTLIAGRYRLDERLGEGGMGEVWAATHTITRRRVGMKFLKSSTLARADMRQRLLREARAASVVRHPSVVEVLDAFEMEGGGPVLVMDLLVGETLGAKLAGGGALSARETSRLLMPVVEAVEAAHVKGIVHRDLKPDNIFLSRGEAGDIMVKVLDFGIAKLTAKEGDAADTGAITGTGSVVGTPWYMAPEQCYGERDIDPRADVWALGVILYECLAGVRPVEGASIGQVLKRMLHEGIVPIEQRAAGVPPELAALVGRMLSHARENRPRDLSEVRRVLAALAGGTAFVPSAAPLAPSRVDESASAGGVRGIEPRPPPARPDTDASHAVPRLSTSQSLGKSRRSWIALALISLAVGGVGIVYTAGRGRHDDVADRVPLARSNAPVAAAFSLPEVRSVDPPPEIASSVWGTPSAGAAKPQPARLPTRAPPMPASGPRPGPTRAAVDAASAAPRSSAIAPTSAQPTRPNTPEGRLFEDVPF